MQVCPILTRSQCEVPDTQVTVKAVGLLLFCMVDYGFYTMYT